MRKKLLSEAQVRRFQSLASIKPLNEMGDKAYKKDEPMEEMAYKKEDDKMEALYEEEDDAPPAIEMDDEGDDEMDADVSIDEELVEKFMEAAETIQELASALEGGAGDMDDDMDDMGDMGDMGDDMDDMGDDMDDMKMDADAGDDLGGDDEEPMNLDEALQGISYVPSQKEIVSTVAKRVAKRLQEAKRAEARLNRALGKRR